jgi:hypothetical protein
MATPAHADRRRPKLVWAVFLYVLFSAGYTMLSFLLILSGHIRVTPEQAAYFESLWPLDYMLFLAVAALNLAGAVSLFVLRRFAFQLFAAAVLLNIVVTIVYAASKGWLAALGGRWSGRHVARVRSLGRNLRLRLEAQVARSIGMTTDRGR